MLDASSSSLADLGSPEWRGAAGVSRARIRMFQGRLEEAEQCLLESNVLHQTNKSGGETAYLLVAWVRLRVLQGELDRARECLEEAEDFIEAREIRELHVLCLLEAARTQLREAESGVDS